WPLPSPPARAARSRPGQSRARRRARRRAAVPRRRRWDLRHPSATGASGERCSRSVPARDCDARAVPGWRVDGEFVAQTLRTAEPEAQAVRRGVAVGERERDIRDAGPPVAELEADAGPPGVAQCADRYLAPAAVRHGIASELARRGDELRLIHQA